MQLEFRAACRYETQGAFQHQEVLHSVLPTLGDAALPVVTGCRSGTYRGGMQQR